MQIFMCMTTIQKIKQQKLPKMQEQLSEKKQDKEKEML